MQPCARTQKMSTGYHGDEVSIGLSWRRPPLSIKLATTVSGPPPRRTLLNAVTLHRKELVHMGISRKRVLMAAAVHHLTARPCTSEDWSLISFSTALQIFFSPSESGLKDSFCSSVSRSDVAMYRKSLSLKRAKGGWIKRGSRRLGQMNESMRLRTD